MPDVGEGHQAWRRRKCVSVWLALLLAIAPLADREEGSGRFDPASLQRAALQADSLADPQEPMAASRPGQPVSLGVLSRLLVQESASGLPPAKTPFLGAAARYEALPAPAAPARLDYFRLDTFHRGAIGTARTPTGPPA